jgi:ADP-ribose pyrophosphatase
MPSHSNKPHEETMSSTRAFDGALLHVRDDRVRLPSGHEGVREVVEHPGAVAVIARTVDDHIVLVRQWRHAIGDYLLETPAGTLDREEEPIETARRELREETGYEAESLTEIASFYSSAGYTDEKLIVFVAEGCRAGEKQDDTDEPTEVVLVPVADLKRLLAFGPDQIRDATTLIGLFWLAANR